MIRSNDGISVRMRPRPVSPAGKSVYTIDSVKTKCLSNRVVLCYAKVINCQHLNLLAGI